MSCTAKHPTLGLECTRPSEGPGANHSDHTCLNGLEYVDWPNEAYKPIQKFTKKTNNSKNIETLRNMANKINPEIQAKPVHYLPNQTTRLGRVALHFIEHLNVWIDEEELQDPYLGGSSAANRVQELINLRWPIKVGKNKWKLTEDPTAPLWDNETVVK